VIKFFNAPWPSVPVVCLDVETTGVRPGIDRAVQVGIVRFESGVVVGEFGALLNPGRPIPQEATAIHGITDEMVAEAVDIESLFKASRVVELLNGAQPCAFNASFDKAFVPTFTADHAWPWLDPLTLVRAVDRYARGAGRHRLEVAAARHGIEMKGAHDAVVDARACGQLFFKLAPGYYGKDTSLGEVLRTQRVLEANDWARFCDWLAKQTPRDVA
jgi:DNA polymerase-3 subunit epsilon